MRKKAINFLIPLLVLSVFLGCGWFAHAEQTGNGPVLSNYERAVFSYFKLIEKSPNYRVLVEGFPAYKNTKSKYVKNKIYAEESPRLKESFKAYEVGAHYIGLKSSAYALLTMDFKIPMINFRFTDTGGGRTPYIPYEYGDQWISIVLDDFEKFSYLPLDSEKYASLKDVFQQKKLYDVDMEVYVLPVSAQGEPVEKDGQIQRLMQTKTAWLRFTYTPPASSGREKTIVLGEFQADWYDADAQNGYVEAQMDE